jgi:thiamine-monophosphate kinase
MERDLIRWLRQRLPPHPLLRLGLGDDAAVLDMAHVAECVVTVDMLTDRVDFELSKIDPRRAGRKALAANLSDLAAMAARPLAGVVALALPRQGAMELAAALYEGMLPLAERYDLAIAGGDTNSWDGPLAISITLLGAVTNRGSLRRAGAMPGDRILVTGSFGGSILGRHLDFEPRVREALLLNERYQLHAGIDVSDGLSLDLAHVIEESHCGAVINTDIVPVADDARRLAEQLADGSTPLSHALGDGEDFELILAVPPDEARRMLLDQPLRVPLLGTSGAERNPGTQHCLCQAVAHCGEKCRLADIGEFIAEPGLWQIDASGVRRPLVPRGWEHGFGES